MDVLVVTVLALWQVGLLAAQLRPAWLWRWIGRFRVRSLFPVWELFIGPQTDLSLFLRDRLDDGTLTDWSEEPVWPGGVRPSILWAPCFWRAAALAALLRKLVRRERERAAGGFLAPESLPLRALWTFILGRPRSPLAATRQFRVVRTQGSLPSGPGEDAYVSEFRPLPRGALDRRIVDARAARDDSAASFVSQASNAP